MKITEFFAGVGYLLQGFSLITQRGIRPFVILPLMINIVVFSGGVWLGMNQLDNLMQKLLPSWLSWLEWLLWPMFAVLIFFAIFYTFSILANLIAAPFNAILAERVEARLKGLPVAEFQGYRSIADLIGRTFKSELQKLFYMLKWLVLLLILTFIPVVNIIAPFAWILYGAWMLAIEYADYPMGNHNLFFKEELPVLRQYRSHSLGFGGALSLLTTIPFVNFIAMPVGVAGATVLWVKRLSTDFRVTQ